MLGRRLGLVEACEAAIVPKMQTRFAKNDYILKSSVFYSVSDPYSFDIRIQHFRLKTDQDPDPGF